MPTNVNIIDSEIISNNAIQRHLAPLFIILICMVSPCAVGTAYSTDAATCENDPNQVLEGDECVEYSLGPNGNKVVVSRINLPTGRQVSFVRDPISVIVAQGVVDPALEAVRRVDNRQTLAYLTNDVWINASDVSVYQFGAVKKSDIESDYLVDLKGVDASGAQMLAGQIRYSVSAAAAVDQYTLTYEGGEDKIGGKATVYLYPDGSVRLASINESKSSARVTGTNQVKVGYDAAGIVIFKDNKTLVQEVMDDGGSLQTSKTAYLKDGSGYEKTEITRRNAKGKVLALEKTNSELGPGAVVLSTSSSVAAYAYDPVTNKKIREIQDTTTTTSDGFSHVKHVYNTFTSLGTPDIRSTWSEQVFLSPDGVGKVVLHTSSSQNYSTNLKSLANLLDSTAMEREERYNASNQMVSRSQVVTSSQAKAITEKRTTMDFFGGETGSATHETVQSYVGGRVSAVQYRVEIDGAKWIGAAALDASGNVTAVTYQMEDEDGALIGAPVVVASGAAALTDMKEAVMLLKGSGAIHEDEALRDLGLLNSEGKVDLLMAVRAYVQADRARSEPYNPMWDLDKDGKVDELDLADLNDRLRRSVYAGAHIPIPSALSADMIGHEESYDQALTDAYALMAETDHYMSLADVRVDTAEVRAGGLLAITISTGTTTPNSSNRQQSMEAVYNVATGERDAWHYTETHYESFAPDPMPDPGSDPYYYYNYNYCGYNGYCGDYGSLTTTVDESLSSGGIYHKYTTETNNAYGSYGYGYGYYGYYGSYGYYGPTTSTYEYTLDNNSGDYTEKTSSNGPLDSTYYGYGYQTSYVTERSRATTYDSANNRTLVTLHSTSSSNYDNYSYPYYYNYYGSYPSTSDERTEVFGSDGYHQLITKNINYDSTYMGYTTTTSTLTELANGDWSRTDSFDSPNTNGPYGPYNTTSSSSKTTAADGTVTLQSNTTNDSYYGYPGPATESRIEIMGPGPESSRYYHLEEHRNDNYNYYYAGGYGKIYDHTKTINPSTDSESEYTREGYENYPGTGFEGYESKSERVGPVTKTSYTQFGSTAGYGSQNRTYANTATGKSYSVTQSQDSTYYYGVSSYSGSVTFAGQTITFQSDAASYPYNGSYSSNQIVFDYNGGRLMDVPNGDLDQLCSFLESATLSVISTLSPRQQESNYDLTMLDQQSAMMSEQQEQMASSDPNMSGGFESPV